MGASIALAGFSGCQCSGFGGGLFAVGTLIAAMALTALALLRDEETPAYRQVVDDVLDYLDTATRTEDGGINHLGPRLAEFIPGIWLDSLFMFGMVLNRHGEASDDAGRLRADQRNSLNRWEARPPAA